MAYTEVKTVATGDGWTAGDMNTYVKDNFAAGIPDIFTTKGDLGAAAAENQAVRLAAGSDNTILSADSTQDAGLKWIVPPLRDYIAAKGNLLAATGADALSIVAVGSDGQILQADSTQGNGVSWITAGLDQYFTAKGQLLVGTGIDTSDLLNMTSFSVTAVVVTAEMFAHLQASTAETLQMKWAQPNYFAQAGQWTTALNISRNSSDITLHDTGATSGAYDPQTLIGSASSETFYTAPVTGYYYVTAGIRVELPQDYTSTASGCLELKANSSALDRLCISDTFATGVMGTRTFYLKGSTVLYLTASSTISLSVHNTNFADTISTASGGVIFEVIRLGAY